VLYLSGVVRPDMPAMLTPRMGQIPSDDQPWGADNGRFASPHEYTDEGYLAWLERMAPYRDRCLFATAPDVWGDWQATMELSEPMVDRIREAGYPVAVVAQDGLTPDLLPWKMGISALFIGGSDRWRHSGVLEPLVREARRHGLWVHMGRVNSWRRFDYARAIGCDSADGTVLKHDPSRDVAGWMERAQREPHIWSKP